jgi:hypothetical protein
MNRLGRFALTGLFVLGGCARTPVATAPPNAFDGRPYDRTPLSAHTKVFLVAGGDDIANFAYEVLEQRTLWRRAGLREDQIACYWAKPTDEAWLVDREQYEALALALSSCRVASPGRLTRDLKAAAASADDFVYLYVTGHGLASQLRPLEASTVPRTRTFVASLSEAERAVLQPAAIGLHGDDGPALGDPRGIVGALRRGAPPEAVAFTPATLASTLAAFPDDVKKVVVLQACFSGGFIDHHVPGESNGDPAAAALLQVPNLTVLTATAAERPSFGCAAGNTRTYFGGVYNLALRDALEEHPVDALPWQDIHARVSFAVEAMENAVDQQPSHPGFASN